MDNLRLGAFYRRDAEIEKDIKAMVDPIFTGEWLLAISLPHLCFN